MTSLPKVCYLSALLLSFIIPFIHPNKSIHLQLPLLVPIVHSLTSPDSVPNTVLTPHSQVYLYQRYTRFSSQRSPLSVSSYHSDH